jgi:hypothetical protein
MTKISLRAIPTLTISAGLLASLVALASAPAHAQATRTWVSGVGDDVNPCSRTAPCKTFAGAVSKTVTAGEINCLDSGGFCGTVTGHYASMSLPASSVQAQATRTLAAGAGDDVNPRSRTASGKTFAGAISKTAAGGEIDCLDPGRFGAVAIANHQART